jgi:uncharacterized protein (DUF58 family)
MASESKQKLRYLEPAILQKVQHLELLARQVVEGMRVGMHKSPLRGFSTEFSQHRQYVQGDSLRHIDWRVYGRNNRYYIKTYEAETNFTANLLLDASRSMVYTSGKVSKLEYAKYMAASMAYLIINQRDTVGLGIFDAELRTYIPPKSTLGILTNIAVELEKAQPLPRTNVASLLHEFATRMPRRGFVVLFSDLLDNVDEFLKGLDHLRFRGHNVIVFHVLDPYELRFPFDGTWKFKGLEEDGEVVTQPRRIRAAYMDELNKFLSRIKGACQKKDVDYVLVDTSRPIAEVLSAYLIGRSHGVGVR